MVSPEKPHLASQNGHSTRFSWIGMSTLHIKADVFKKSLVVRCLASQEKRLATSAFEYNV